MGDDDGAARRVARPPRHRYMPSTKEHSEAWFGLLSKIESSYKEARHRLAVHGRPESLSRFLDAGVCIGLLDPVSNIMVNTICASDRRPDPDHREKVVLAGGSVVADDDEKLAEMARLSMKGLIAFLLYFFPYLAEWEAVRYLFLSDAELLCAARTIVADRGMLRRFSLDSPASAPAVEAALALAAQVAKHPKPSNLVRVWMLLSSRLHQAVTLLSEPLGDLDLLKGMLNDPVAPNLAMSWDLAASRPAYKDAIAKMSYQHTRSLRLVLLDTIHGFYLQALARLPRGELRSHLHRSLLKAGYCYGPMDPVSNIIYNTIWYHANFPAAVTPVLDAISPKSLTRLESRSFYGLVSFIQTRYHHLSEHQAVQCLIAACGQLSLADPKLLSSAEQAANREQQHHNDQRNSDSHHLCHCMCNQYDKVFRSVEQQSPCSSLQEAYMAAAIAAWHPNPDEQATFLASWKGDPAVMNQLTSEDVHHWSKVMSPAQPPTPERVCKSGYPVKIGKKRSLVLQRRISRMVKAALAKHLLQDGKPAYDLHIIYNTIWYHANFPAAVTPVLDAIGPKSLTRLESRSFYGLVSFIQTRYHHLSEHQAVQCLIAACGQLSLADPKLISTVDQAEGGQHHRQRFSDSHHLCHCMSNHYDEVIRNVEQQSPCAGVQEAYIAAATAAWHPNPDKQATFLASWKGDPIVMNWLTSEDVRHWSKVMSPEQPPTPVRVCKSGYPVKIGKKRSLALQRRVSRKVKAALNKHLLQDGKPAYDLHIISCVNEYVCGPEYCDEVEDCLSFAPCRFLYTHVNFLVTQKDSASSPTLFFAEFDNEKEDGAPLVCCPVGEPIAFAEHVRCLYCEAAGARLCIQLRWNSMEEAMSLRR